LSGRGLCDELITRPKESYRLCCVVVCDLETSRIGAPYIYIYIYIYDISSLRVNNNFIFFPICDASPTPSFQALNQDGVTKAEASLHPFYHAALKEDGCYSLLQPPSRRPKPSQYPFGTKMGEPQWWAFLQRTEICSQFTVSSVLFISRSAVLSLLLCC